MTAYASKYVSCFSIRCSSSEPDHTPCLAGWWNIGVSWARLQH